MSNQEIKLPPFYREFKEWCLKKGYPPKTTEVYVSNIRAAYHNFCYWHKGLLEGIEKSFNSVISRESEDLIEIECWIDGLDEYIDDLKSFKNGISIEGRDDEWKDAPVTDWINSFNKYREFLGYKLQELKHEILGESHPEIEVLYKFPLKKEFTKYLQDWHFPEVTIWTYNSRLRKCVIAFFQNSVFKEFIDNTPELVKNGESLELISQRIEGIRMVFETEKEFRENPIYHDRIKDKESHVTAIDLRHAIKALEQYEFFLKDLIKSQEKNQV